MWLSPASIVPKKFASSFSMTPLTRFTVSDSSGYGRFIISATAGTSLYRNGSRRPI